MSSMQLFEEVVEFPDPCARSSFARLVGLEDYAERLVKEALLLLDPSQLEQWSQAKHGCKLAALEVFTQRPPLFVLGGDVGTGKSTLARSFGEEVARRSRTQIQLYALSLNSRGSGAVGEMTRLISDAFEQVVSAVSRSRGNSGRSSRGAILLIDEADSLAQSREAAQMHHEDRAGVNALIRGIDRLAQQRLPVVVVMCTNRLEALDPAVRRRAAAVFEFLRPTHAQRLEILKRDLGGAGFSDADFAALAAATGDSAGRGYGFTFSDMTQRLVPALVLDAFPEHELRPERALELVHSLRPTPPFQAQEGT